MTRPPTSISGLISLFALILLAGCSDARDRAVALHNLGDFGGARAMVSDPGLDHEKNGENDRLIWLIEEGKIDQDAGDPAGSAKALDAASDWCERFAIYEPKTTISEEAASVVINQKMRVFRGTYSDRIMVDSYAALDALWLGDVVKAGVYANRVAERQKDAEVEQAKQIDKVQSQLKTYDGGRVNGLLDQVRRSGQMQGVESDSAYSAYLNPFASWIAAMAWSATGDSSNLEKAAASLKKALSMVPQNRVLAAQAAANPFAVAAAHPQVLILFEGGRGPTLKELLIPLVTPWTGYSQIPLPLPDYHPSEVQGLAIDAGSTQAVTEALSDNDAIFKAQYDRMLPEIVFRTAIMVGAKEAGTVAAVQATRRNSNVQVLVLTAMSLYKALTNRADIRSWGSIGKFTQIAQVDRPESGVVNVAVVAGGATGPASAVALPPGRVILLYVRSVSAMATVIYPIILMPDPAAG